MKSLLAAAFLILSIAAPQAQAWSGPIQFPELNYPNAGLSEEQKKQYRELREFMRDDLEFVDGRFMSLTTHQRFNGTSAKVGEFLTKLRDASTEKITVFFRDLPDPDKVAFTLHQGHHGTIVTVNTSRPDLKLSDFKAFLPGAAEKKKAAPTNAR